MNLAYRILFDKKSLIKSLINVPKDNLYRNLICQIIKKPNLEIWKILVDSYFFGYYGIKMYNSYLVLPKKLLKTDGDFITYLSNLVKKLISGDPMNYHNELSLLARRDGQGLFSDDIKKNFGTIFTPDFVVDKCLDLAWKYYNGNKLEATYCDPSCGDGNFLVALHDRLMKEPSDLTGGEKSKYIIENCLWGGDIIDGMVEAAKISLFDRHLCVCGDDLIPIEKWNIHWGNTICLPEDTEQDWYGEREEWEGGLLPEELRDKKYDVIVGNPPYCHLRGLDNRRYAAYPKQRDLAQVFVRWALDHINEDGVISYDTIDTWLNVKVCDGAKETRSLIDGKLREVFNDDSIKKYSYGDGGSINTMVICIGPKGLFMHNGIIIENYDIYKVGFLKIDNNAYPFKRVSVENYAPILRGGRSINSYGGKEEWDFIYMDDDGELYALAVKCRICDRKDGKNTGNFKLIHTDDFDSILHSKFKGEIKNCSVSKDHGLWLIGYFNTYIHFKYIDTFSNKIGKNDNAAYELTNNLWPFCQVPDFDYYKQNRPKQFAAYMEWIEENMHDKDEFLNGIDEEFDKLIK